MSNVGRIIRDFYCNGFFGRDYDYDGSIIVAEGEDWIVVRKPSGIVDFASFQDVRWERDAKGNPIDLKLIDSYNKQVHIDKWCD